MTAPWSDSGPMELMIMAVCIEANISLWCWRYRKNLIPMFLNLYTHVFFSICLLSVQSNYMFRWAQHKNYQIYLSRLCALSSQKYFLHMTWPLRKKNTYSFRGEWEWLLLHVPEGRENEGNEKQRSQRSGTAREWKNIEAIIPGNGNRNGENKTEWKDYTTKYLENI